MLLLPIMITLFSQFQGLNSQAVDAFGITLYEKIEAMERQLLVPQKLQSLVSPCDENFGFDPNQGEQTSAEWTRIVFHDVITKNIEGPGLGGLDASIGFESDRPENVGVFINVTLNQFNQFFGTYLSMSDLIAMGIAESLASCANDHRFLPLRLGRIDATRAGPAGVPGPADFLAFATAAFAKAGFSSTEMIQAVACGHSLGGVHQTNFKDIVDPNLSLVNNTDGRDPFDSTPAIFDNTQMTEYLTGTGKKGGPLVVTHNVTERSDLRIFSSDKNVTIKAMSSPSSFEDTCFTIFEKMINTVPDKVILSDPVGPREWTMQESHVDITSAGAPTYQGTIKTHSKTATPPANASYFYGTVGGGNTGPKFSQGASSQPSVPFGTITDYNFFDVLNSPQITSINVTNNAYTAPINMNFFVVPSMSFISSTTVSGAANLQHLVRVAVLGSLAPAGTTLTGTVWYNTAQQGTVVQKLNFDTFTLTFLKNVGTYKIFSGTVTKPGVPGTTDFGVKMGTTQVSAKVNSILFGTTCSTIPNC